MKNIFKEIETINLLIKVYKSFKQYIDIYQLFISHMLIHIIRSAQKLCCHGNEMVYSIWIFGTLFDLLEFGTYTL